MGNIIGDNFRDWVTNQVNIRQEKLGAFNKDESNLVWQNNKTSWLRLISAVSVSATKSKELTNTENYSGRKLAQHYTLFGGVTYDPTKPRAGVLDASYNGLNDNVYGFDSTAEGQGLVPMPGLTSADIDSVNRGALRKGQIKIKANNKHQFDIIDALYMRPGYNILLEWGHTLYFNNDGELTQPEYYTTPFNMVSEGGRHPNKILKAIDETRKAASGNYDGFFGTITNFTWNFNGDGSYDITLNVVSIGSVVESLNINKTQPVETSQSSPNAKDKPILYKDKSRLHRFLYNLYLDITTYDPTEVTVNNLERDIDEFKAKHSISVAYPYQSTVGSGVPVEGDIRGYDVIGLKIATKGEYNYIRLGAFLKYINDNLLIYNNKDENYISIDSDIDTNFCFTFPKQFSTNPGVCVIPFKAQNLKGHGCGFFSKILSNTFRDTESKYVGKLMGIHINIEYLRTTIDDTLNLDGELNLLEFLQNIMDGVEGALGSINKFTVSYNYEDNQIKIYDDIPLLIKKKNETQTVFQSYGVKENLGSFITNISLNASITSNFATMIAIGAQANGNTDLLNATAFSRWNEGLEDSTFKEKISKQSDQYKISQATPDEEAIQTFKDSWQILIDRIIVPFYNHVGDTLLSEETIDLVTNTSKDAFKYLVGTYNKEENVPSAQGFIPFDLGLEMEGISGPRIYEQFSTDGNILPPSYPKNLSFLIKGLKDTIGVDGWKTTLTSLTVESPPPQIDRSKPTTNPFSRPPAEILFTPNANRLRQTLTKLGYSEKGNSISENGDITSQMERLASSVFTTINEQFPSTALLNIQVTAGNDTFHAQKSNSRHFKGNAIDFTVSPATDSNIREVEKILQGYAAHLTQRTYVRFLNEYVTPSTNSTGRHFHLSYGVGTESASEIKEAIQLAEDRKIITYKIT